MSNIISVLRPYWKCLQSMNDIDKLMSLEKYLKDWDENHRKNIKFFEPKDILEKTEEQKIKFYKLAPQEEIEKLDKEVNELIEVTNLFVPNNRLFDIDLGFNEENQTNENILVNSSILESISNVSSSKVLIIL